MIYSIIGTSSNIREKARKELASLGEVTERLYSEDVDTVEPLIDLVSIFGDVTIVECVQMLEKIDAKERVYDLLPRMQNSQTIFIIDEPFGDAHKRKKLNTFSKKMYDATEEKEKNTIVFDLANYVAKRDKKNAWRTFLVCKKEEEAEAIQGALWWKFVQVWTRVVSGGGGPFSKEECEVIGKKLLLAPIMAHKGEADLMIELEKIILSI